jgi:circadian clock protein KaiC
MSKWRKPTIRMLSSGVPGLDVVLGGGLPEYSFNLIAGDPGAGKTTLAQQILFSRASVEQPALYFTVLGEPPLKMLRHMQQYSFFDQDRIGSAIQFVNLSAEAMEQDLDTVLQRILAEVNEIHPALVVVDSFRTVAHAKSEADLQKFVQRLALHLTGWQATTFLVGEYSRMESHTNPLFTVADGILWLSQHIDRNACMRRLHVMKLRAGAPMAGLHTFVMSAGGIRVFPRLLPRSDAPLRLTGKTRASTGLAALDAMMHGGIPEGQVALFVGPSGVGKSLFARQFIAAGAEAGERGVIVVFEEHEGEYLARADEFGPKLKKAIERRLVEVVCLRPLDLTSDEALAVVRDAIDRNGARRLAIDSLSGFELALSPSYRDDFREALFRVVNALTGLGVTVMMTENLVQRATEFTLSPHITEFLADVIVLLRYVELEGRLEKLLAVVKMRSSRHDTAVRRYTVDESGVVLGEAMRDYRGALLGAPGITPEGVRAPVGLTAEEAALLANLRDIREASVRELTRRTGARPALLSSALKRLMALGYITRVTRGAASLYRYNSSL